MEILKCSIDEIELNILNPITSKELAQKTNLSESYFKNAFHIVTGYTVTEYIRNRRLYLAATDILSGHDKLINIAFKYGYETQESFSKAYSRFHGITPSQTREQIARVHVFRPIRLQVIVEGGEQMNYRIERMNSFCLWGVGKQFSRRDAHIQIPKF